MDKKITQLRNTYILDFLNVPAKQYEKYSLLNKQYWEHEQNIVGDIPPHTQFVLYKNVIPDKLLTCM